jgi:hypothetical protein
MNDLMILFGVIWTASYEIEPFIAFIELNN